jgi:hypothetical protein
VRLIYSSLLAFAAVCSSSAAEPPRSISGIYPHLAFFNEEGECGTGAVVPWADRLWVVTYAPHKPQGSTDKLYEITPDLQRIVRPESIGGTPANRMIHRESRQLFIGPYAIDDRAGVRTIPYDQMFGRPTGNARHLFDPAGKIYYATMEEGLYEVDVKTLAVKELWADEQRKQGRHADLPGYHGKGLYSTQGRLIYANNGEHGPEALKRPDVPSGVLAEWDGKADAWTVVRRNQFTEVTGPGGIYGNERPDDPVWSVGWDHRSLILMLLDAGQQTRGQATGNQWHAFRLPKASHSYDGAHGWNTEWPRIRDIGTPDEPELLMTMHGTFWRFPRTFSAANTAGIEPLSNYLKVIGDYCRWNDRLVFGCDDAAKSEFLNKRRVKGEIAGVGRSQSNLWFVEPNGLKQFGPKLGRGAVWLEDDVQAGAVSDPFLFSGYERRSVHLAHRGKQAARVTFEIDERGDGNWRPLRDVTIPAEGYMWTEFTAAEQGAWIRVRAKADLAKATALFTYADADQRTTAADERFAALAPADAVNYDAGIVRTRGDDANSLSLAAVSVRGDKLGEGYYEMTADLRLRPVDNAKDHEFLKQKAAVPRNVVTVEPSSVLVIDDRGRRFRLPRGHAAFDREGALPLRTAREVATERDLLNLHGTFYELPAENADGFAKLRPIATHNRRITDFCSWRGLLVLSGVRSDAAASAVDEHLVRSDDGQAAVWLGAVDDLWKFGKPVGTGGPWLDSKARAGEPSDPYLFTGYDRKRLAFSHAAVGELGIRIEADITGTGHWQPYRTFRVPAGETVEHEFPEAFQAYWIRAVADRDCTATVRLTYE